MIIKRTSPDVFVDVYNLSGKIADPAKRLMKGSPAAFH